MPAVPNRVPSANAPNLFNFIVFYFLSFYTLKLAHDNWKYNICDLITYKNFYIDYDKDVKRKKVHKNESN